MPTTPQYQMNTDTGFDWGGLLGNLGSAAGAGASLYGGYQNMQNQNNLTGAANNNYMMAGGAYNPSLFSGSGVGGTGFSVSSPTNGKPGSINTSLGAMNPMYGQYAGASNQFMNQSQGLANTAASGAQGAYQSALSSIMPQLNQMQGNLLAQNSNALFQRGQMGSGSFGQMGAGGNPVNLTTQSLGAGFAQQDLNAITAAQNQGLNFFNSNMQGATAMGGLGMGATNTGLGMIGAQNQLGQNPLAYSGLYGNQQIGASNAMSNAVHASNYQGGAYGSGISNGLSPFMSPQGAGGQGGQGGGGMGGIGQILGGAKALYGAGSTAYNWLTGGGQGGGGGGLLGNMGDMSGGSYNGGAFGGGAPYGGPDTGYTGDYGGMQAGGGSWDFTGPLGFNSAGGEAANAMPPQQQMQGMAGGGSQSPGGLAGIGKDVGMGFDALGVYQGIQKGGVMGYGGAALNAAKLGNAAGLTSIPGVGPAGAVLASYSAIKNYQSGKTGADAIQGAEAGAAWGSMFGPVGTVVGAVIGGAAGAIASAFGGGARDPESMMQGNIDAALSKADPAAASQAMQGMSPTQGYQYLAGVMDAKNNSPGHSEAIEQVFGRMGEGNLMTQMTDYINTQAKAGKITKGESVGQQWTDVINPWLQSKGASIDPNQRDVKGNKEGANIISDLQGLVGNWESGALNKYTPVGVSGETISGLGQYGYNPVAAVAPTAARATPSRGIGVSGRGGRGQLR